jgi:hypothetical protein
MGILDDLKREADLARQNQEAAERHRTQLERIYRDEIEPRLTKIHSYLSEMRDCLNTVGWAVEATYQLPGFGTVKNLQQSNYRIYVDSHKALKKIIFEVEGGYPDERKFAVESSKLEEARQFLISQNVVFTEWPAYQGTDWILQGKLRIKLGVVIEADIENSRIKVISHNIEGLNVRHYQFVYSNVDEAWLDQLGRYILRKVDHLGYTHLPDETRLALREKVAEQKARWLQELKELELAKESKDSEFGLIQGLRRKFFKSS